MTLFGPIAEQPIALLARSLLDCRLGNFRPTGGQRRVPNPEPVADAGDHRRFRLRFTSEAMVDGRFFDLAGPSSSSEQHQCQTVGSAGDRNADASVRCDKRIEIDAKAIEKSRVHASFPPGLDPILLRAGAARLQIG